METANRLPVDAQGSLIADIACRRCGYNLRGLREEGACPECGSAVGLSTRGDFLRFASPTWVNKLAFGLSIILWSILFSILSYCAVFSVAALAPGMAPATLILVLLANLVGFIGAWLLTEADPSALGEDRYAKARKIARIGLFVSVGLSLTEVIQSVLPSSPAIITTFEIIGMGLGAVALIGEFFLFVYIEHLALRIPDPKLASRSRLLRWTIVIATGSLILSKLMQNISASLKSNALEVAVAIPAIFGSLLLLAFGVACLFFYFRLSRVIREQAGLAQTTWARDVALAEVRKI